MKKQLIQQLKKMDDDLKVLFQVVERHGEAEINQQPAPGKWSAQQIMNHLILSEKYSLGYCTKKLSFDPPLNKSNWKTKIREWAVINYFNLPLKINAPRGIDTPALPDHDTLDSIKNKWQNVRTDIKSFLESVDEKYLDKEVYKHPFVGRLSIKGMMIFLGAHFRHHRKQIDKALKL